MEKLKNILQWWFEYQIPPFIERNGYAGLLDTRLIPVLIGPRRSGKSTLFTLLTGQAPDTRHDAVTTGMATVPDDRLDRLSALFHPKKHTPATIRYVDVPGIPAEHGREGSLNISELRTMDVLMVVVRAFESDVVPHPLLSVNPIRDLERIEEEFLLQDLLQCPLVRQSGSSLAIRH